MDAPEAMRACARVTGFIGSLLTIVLGILHIFLIGASIHWPDGKFTADTQLSSWRAPMFSLRPDVLFETWTPFILGLAGSLAHLRDYKRFRIITESFINYFAWNMFQGLFGTIAYNGGLGIIFSIPVWISAFLSLMVLIVDDGDASLDLNVRLDNHLKILLWGAKRSGKTSILYRWKLDTYIPTVPTMGLLEETFMHHRDDAVISKIDVAEVGRDPVSIEMRCSIKVNEDDEESDSSSDSPYKYTKRRKSNSYLPRTLRHARLAIRCCRQCCSRCLKMKQRSTDFAVETWTRIIQRTNAIVYVIDSSSRSSLVEMFDDMNFIMSNDSNALRYARIVLLANKQDVVGAISPSEIERMLDLPPIYKERIRVFGTSALTGQNIEEALKWLEDIGCDVTGC